MVRVLEVFDSLEMSGGVQVVIMNIFRRIDHNLVKMDFAVYHNPEENSFYDEVCQNGGDVINVSNPSACGFVKFYHQFIKIFSKTKYDAVHAHNIHHNGLILLAAKKAGIPIRISHSHQAYDDRNTSILRRIMVCLLEMINIRVATRRIACSDLAGNFLYGKHSYEIIPNAIDIDRFNVKQDKETIRKGLGISKDKKVLIHVGRFYVPKNQFFLIEIMNNIRYENCILLMVGDGPLYNDFIKKVEAAKLNEKIICLGSRKDVPELLSISDCMLLPSIYEGLPVVAVEAQATGCSCLISDSVTKQADLGLGLVEFLSIKDAYLWSERIKHLPKIDKLTFEQVKERMVSLRFETESNLKSWYELYGVVEA